MCFRNIILFCTFFILAKIAYADVDCSKPPRMGILSGCCNHELPINEELKEMCLAQIPSDKFDDEPLPDPHHPLPPRFMCLYECVLNGSGIYSYEDQTIIEDKLDEFLYDGYANSPEFIPVVKQAIQQCAEKQKEIMNMVGDHPPHAHRHRHHCRGFPLHCMKFEVFKNCPNEYWIQSEECIDLREFMNTCSQPPPPQHGPHGPHGHGHEPHFDNENMFTTYGTPAMD